MTEEELRRRAGRDLLEAASTEWDEIASSGYFDYVVVGSGICALAFVDAVLRSDSRARILVVERGGFLLPENLQGLDIVFAPLLGSATELYPWRSYSDSGNALFVRGILPYVGGKSLTWSGWCPRPTHEELSAWPVELAAVLSERFAEAEAFLGVVGSDEIGDLFGYYSSLQRRLHSVCARGVREIPELESAEPARLALADAGRGGLGFRKFSVPAPLFSLLDRVRLVSHCTVEHIEQRAGAAVALHTTRGTLPLRGANLILAAGTIPSTALVMSAFREVVHAGTGLTAHSITLVRARVPIEDLPFAGELAGSELAALYIPGTTKRSTFHLQITGVRCDTPETMYPILRRHAPDCDAFVAPAQLAGSERFVVLSCAALGEFGSSSGNCRVVARGEDLRIHLTSSELDRLTWDTMDAALFNVIENVLSPCGPFRVHYWVDDPTGGRWRRHRPSLEQRRQAGLVHEGSTLRIGKDPASVVDLDYRVRGSANVYLTGGALWPVAGSANPTLSMVVLARHLAERLTTCRLSAPSRKTRG